MHDPERLPTASCGRRASSKNWDRPPGALGINHCRVTRNSSDCLMLDGPKCEEHWLRPVPHHPSSSTFAEARVTMWKSRRCQRVADVADVFCILFFKIDSDSIVFSFTVAFPFASLTSHVSQVSQQLGRQAGAAIWRDRISPPKA